MISKYFEEAETVLLAIGIRLSHFECTAVNRPPRLFSSIFAKKPVVLSNPKMACDFGEDLESTKQVSPVEHRGDGRWRIQTVPVL
jgi:hypothetical protein